MKKINNKGFTVVELLLSFIFVFTLAFSMYQLLNNYYVKQKAESTKSQLLDYRNQITLAIQNDIMEKSLKSIDNCTNGGRVIDRCLILNFNDGTSKQLAVEKGKKLYDGENYDINYINYGGILYESTDALLLDFRNDYMLYQTYETDDLGNNITLYRISIPIYHNDLDGNYGVNIVAIGYDYDYSFGGSTVIDGATLQSPPDGMESSQGRKYNGYVTSTNRMINSGLKNETIIARVKFDSSNISSYQQFFGNWQLGGGGLSISSRKACFGAQISTNDNYSSNYVEVCSSTTLNPDTFYTIVGTFDSINNKMSIYVNGAVTNKTISANSTIDRSSVAFAIGGNPGNVKNSNLFYGTISHAIVYDRTISQEAINSCLRTDVNTTCLKNNGYADSNKIIDESLIKN